MNKQKLIDSLIKEFQNSKHRVVVSDEGGAIVISTDYVSLVKKAVENSLSSKGDK